MGGITLATFALILVNAVIIGSVHIALADTRKSQEIQQTCGTSCTASNISNGSGLITSPSKHSWSYNIPLTTLQMTGLAAKKLVSLRHNTKLQGQCMNMLSMIARKAFYLIIDDAIMAKTSLCDWRFRVWPPIALCPPIVLGVLVSDIGRKELGCGLYFRSP